MLSQFQKSYQRVEASLQKLTDSITAYNPSESAAEELMAADAAIEDDIEELIKHQQNHVQLEELRRTADALDEQIKNTLRLLADTRKEIQDIPSTDESEERREVKVDEVLSYAKFIAKTTVPPTYRKPIPTLSPIKDSNGDTQITNGIATPPQGTSQDVDKADGEGRAVKELAESRKQWIIPQDAEFVPWPHGEMLRSGVLGKIQKMLEDNIDPTSVLTPEEQAEAERRKQELEEKQKLEEEEKQRQAREQWGSSGQRPLAAEQPFNPDDL